MSATKSILITIPPDVHAAAREAARRRDQSLSAFITSAVRDRLGMHTPEQDFQRRWRRTSAEIHHRAHDMGHKRKEITTKKQGRKRAEEPVDEITVLARRIRQLRQQKGDRVADHFVKQLRQNRGDSDVKTILAVERLLSSKIGEKRRLEKETKPNRAPLQGT